MSKEHIYAQKKGVKERHNNFEAFWCTIIIIYVKDVHLNSVHDKATHMNQLRTYFLFLLKQSNVVMFNPMFSQI